MNFDLKNNGHTLTGIFYETDHNDFLDRFVISKDKRGKKLILMMKEKCLMNLMIMINNILLQQNKIRKGKDNFICGNDIYLI